MTPQPFEELRDEFNESFVEKNGWKLRRPEENAQVILEFFLSHFHQKLLSLKEKMERKKAKYANGNVKASEASPFNQGIDTAISLLGISEKD